MKISEELQCLFSASIEEQDGSYVIDVPERELQLGDLQQGETYRVALVSSPTQSEPEQSKQAETGSQSKREPPQPPVEESEIREVEIEDIGDQGDGITRVERGFVVNTGWRVSGVAVTRRLLTRHGMPESTTASASASSRATA